jgi:Flagellar hook-length control protein FliK
MSAASLSASTAAAASAPQIGTASRTAPADQSANAPSGFPDLLSKMATASNGPPARPAISIAEPRQAWARQMSRVAVAQDGNSDDGESALAALLSSTTGPSTDAGEQTLPAQLPPASPPPDTASMGLGGGSVPMLPLPLPAAVPMPSSATAGPTSPQGQPSAPDAPILQPPALRAGAQDMRAGSAGVGPNAPGTPDGFERPQAPTAPGAQAPMPKEAPRDQWTATNGAVSVGQVVSVVAQETHIAPAVAPAISSSTAQVLRDRAGRASAAGQSAVSKPDAEQIGDKPLSGRTAVPPAGKPAGTPAEPVGDKLPSARAVVMPASKLTATPAEQRLSPERSAGDPDSGRDADGELGNSPAPVQGAASVMPNESFRVPSAAPSPAHQVAGQIVVAANASQGEEAQPVGALAAKPASSPVVKVLRIELQPDDLGTVSVRMSLKQDGLDIRVETSRYDTARLLQRDQDSLAKVLTSAGYRIDGVSVVAAPADGAAVQDGRSQGFLPSSTPQHGGSSQPDSRASGGRSNNEPEPRTSRGNQNDDNDKSRSAGGAGGDLYV